MENIIVIGGGLMGSAATWQLSQYGEKVLLIEQQEPNYKAGSSYGDSRISRSLGPDGDIFSYIQRKSISEAERLISFLNTAESDQLHSMEDIYITSPVTYMFDEGGAEEIKELCHPKQHDSYKVASHKNTFKVFGMTVSESHTVIREYANYSGMINPKVLLSKLHEAIKQCNNSILFEHKIINIFQKDTFYEIEALDLNTQKIKLFFTKKLVVAAGPYTGEVMIKVAPHFKGIITPKRVFIAFIRIKAAVYEAFTDREKENICLSLPTFYQYDDMFYALIDRTDDDGFPIFKTGGHAIYNTIENIDDCWEIPPSAEDIAWSKEGMYKYLKTLNILIKREDIEYVDGQSCVYSLTASKIPLVTYIQNEIKNSLIAIGGMSGIGAKGSLCYGLIAANTLLDKQNDDLMYVKTKDALNINSR